MVNQRLPVVMLVMTRMATSMSVIKSLRLPGVCQWLIIKLGARRLGPVSLRARATGTHWHMARRHGGNRHVGSAGAVDTNTGDACSQGASSTHVTDMI